jgi:hypothetical protein
MKVDHAAATTPIHASDYTKDHVLDLSVDFYTGQSSTISTTGNLTLDSTFNGRIIRSDDTTPVTYTLPNNLPVAFNVVVIQRNVGQITLSPAAGASLHSPSGFTKTRTRYSMIMIVVDDNGSGTAAEYILSGDGA